MGLQRPFSLLPVVVVSGENAWEVDFSISTVELIILWYSEYKEGDIPISFSEAYRLRWFEQAVQDSEGKWWLKNSISIRTPLWKWAKQRGFYIYFLKSEITFPHRLRLPSP